MFVSLVYGATTVGSIDLLKIVKKEEDDMSKNILLEFMFDIEGNYLLWFRLESVNNCSVPGPTRIY